MEYQILHFPASNATNQKSEIQAKHQSSVKIKMYIRAFLHITESIDYYVTIITVVDDRMKNLEFDQC